MFDENNRWPVSSAQMFSRNFRFVRSIVSNYVRSKIFLQCFYLGFTFTRQSSDISHLLSCNPYRCITKATVVGLRTSARRMPKKGKVTRSTQQTLDSEKHEGGAIGSAIFLTKDEQICVKILAKPGAKQSSITGEMWCKTKVDGLAFSLPSFPSLPVSL